MLLSWTTLASAQRVGAVRFLALWFILIPLIAAVVNSSAVPDYIREIKLPFTWGISYLASFLFFIAHVLYLLKCPKLIKSYDSWEHYSKADGSFAGLNAARIAIDKLIPTESKKDILLNLIARDDFGFRELNGTDFFSDAAKKKVIDAPEQYIRVAVPEVTALREMFALYREAGDLTRPFIRGVASFALYLGFFLIGLNTLQGAGAVVRAYL